MDIGMCDMVRLNDGTTGTVMELWQDKNGTLAAMLLEVDSGPREDMLITVYPKDVERVILKV